MTTTALNPRHLTYKPLDEVTADPGEGVWDVRVDRWWCYVPGKGLLFYRGSPQCNTNESLTRKIAEYHSGAVVVFVPRVYLRHVCEMMP